MNLNAIRPVEAANPAGAAGTKVTTIVSLDLLDRQEVAAKIVKAIQFPVTCAIKQGNAVFFAQLKGGKRFACTPVMPKDDAGHILAPANGEEGYLTLELSENAKLTETEGKFEFSVRPVFKDWESLEERKAKEAQPTKK